MTDTRHQRLPALGVLALALVLTGCAISGLAFRVDDRVTIVEPGDRATVTLPVTVTWTVRDFDVTGPSADVRPDAGMFGVFVDRSPQPPGEPLAWLARDDDSCRPADGCPDDRWFNDRSVFVTSQPTITLATLARPVNLRGAERHEVTIVLLDGQGHRIGEAAWHVTFVVDREGGR